MSFSFCMLVGFADILRQNWFDDNPCFVVGWVLATVDADNRSYASFKFSL